MKYLKTYNKLFESPSISFERSEELWSDYQKYLDALNANVLNTIRDILCDFEDDGGFYNIKVPIFHDYSLPNGDRVDLYLVNPIDDETPSMFEDSMVEKYQKQLRPIQHRMSDYLKSVGYVLHPYSRTCHVRTKRMGQITGIPVGGILFHYKIYPKR